MTTEPTWRKASYSSDQGNCVEVADLGDSVGLRDSKHPDQGHVTIPREAVRELVGRVKAGTT